MPLFRKRPAAGEEAAVEVTEEPAEAEAGPPQRGPFDSAEFAAGAESRLDVGSMWIPRRDGVQLRIEFDKASNRVVGINLGLEGSALQLQAFAAPRSSGIWDELRGEIATSVTRQGGAADEADGPFGRELIARLPVRTPEGRLGSRPARFLGVDGPRWFLRGVLTGRAAVDPEEAHDLEEIFGGVVVVRGREPRAPRDLLPLHPPGRPQVPVTGAQPQTDLLTRGPEITEVR